MTGFSSPSIVNLARALLQVQERLRPVVKDETNGYLKTRYATLANVLEAVRKPLTDNGVLLIQRAVDSSPGTVAVETRLIHCSGEWMAGVTSIPLPEAEPGSRVNGGQAVGAAMRGESPEAFMKTLAQTNPQLKGLDLNNLEGAARSLANQKGADINQVAESVKNSINKFI